MIIQPSIVKKGTSSAYVRPADWLLIDALVITNDQKFVGLHAVYNNNSNFCALLCTTSTGNYRVNWGDGTFTDHASNTVAYKSFDYSLLSGTESTRGYRQAIVTITPLTGNLTKVDLYQKHNQSGLVSGYSAGWLDIKISGSFINSLIFGGGGNVKVAMLEQFDFIGNNVLASCANMFYNCAELVKIKNLSIPSLGSISMSFMFYNCYSLQTIPLLNTALVNNMSGMFQNCYSLQTIPLLNTALVNNMASMFNSCCSLQTIPLLNTALVNNMAGMFQNCFSLQTIPLLNTANVNNISAMFYNCYSLQTIPNLQFTSTTTATDFTNIFTTCTSLTEAPIDGIKNTISFANCKLEKDKIVDIFNRLTTQTGKTITITGNWGASLLSAPERAIATGKGWTIVG